MSRLMDKKEKILLEEVTAKGTVIKIERATVEDATRILEIQKSAFIFQARIYDDYEIPPLKETLDELAQGIEDDIYLKLTVDGIIAGSIKGVMKGDVCYVGRLSVDEAYQNRGYGQRLMTAIEGLFPESAAYELITGKRSMKNLHIYEKYGYRITREEQESEKTTIIFMRKENIREKGECYA